MRTTWLNRDVVEMHSLDWRQFADFRESTLANGSRIVDGYSPSGLSITLLPDRGMDIWTAHYKGTPLTWIAPGSPHPPEYGQSWLSLFNGGLMTTCGLTHVGPPEDGRDLHGNYTRQRATTPHVYFDGAPERINLETTVQQSSLFGEQLYLSRKISLYLMEPTIRIRDTVLNLGDEPTPFMLLYHCNVGYPLVQQGTQLFVDSEVYPRDEAATAGVESWQEYGAASPGYAEQVFFHHVRDNGEGTACAALLNAEFGLKFSWDVSSLPYLGQWKNTRQGIYVNGIEPGNCIPEGQNAARESGRLVMLQPGEDRHFDLSITVIEGAESLVSCRREVTSAAGSLIAGCDLTGYERYNK